MVMTVLLSYPAGDKEITYNDLVCQELVAIEPDDDTGTKWVETVVFKTGNYTNTITVSQYLN